MSFNINELIKIRKATSSSEKSKEMVASAIQDLIPKIKYANSMDSEQRQKELVKLMNEHAGKRKNALNSGVASYADPNWAGPAVCETWLYCLLGEDENEIQQANKIIETLQNIDIKEENSKSGYLGYSIILVGCPLVFYFFTWWAALILLFVGLTTLGWKNRYD